MQRELELFCLQITTYLSNICFSLLMYVQSVELYQQLPKESHLDHHHKLQRLVEVRTN